MTINELSDVGFGALNPQSVVRIIPTSKNIGINEIVITTVLVANSPQLLLSVSITRARVLGGFCYVGTSTLITKQRFKLLMENAKNKDS